MEPKKKGAVDAKQHLSGVTLLLVATFFSFVYFLAPLVGAPQLLATIFGLIGLIRVVGAALKKQPEKHWAIIALLFVFVYLTAGAAN